MKQSQRSKYIFSVITLCVVVPIVLGELFTQFFPGKWINIPFHSAIEAIGGTIALVISMIFFIKYQKMGQMTHFNYSSIALITMGIFDIFHAFVPPGNLFVWLHALGVFFGGIFFMGVWLKEKKISESSYKMLPLYFASFALTVSAISMLKPEWIPAMFTSTNSFSMTANFLNVLGGIGFFVATAQFIRRFIESEDISELLFTGHTTLFGIAAILFANSIIWDAQWWLWHFLRLLAYIIAFYFLYYEYDKEIQNIQRLSITDGLTGLYNRRHFNEVLGKELQRAYRESRSISLCVIDIDYFKQFNDTYGHVEGDVALHKVASVLLKHTKRASDHAFRLGGEEFGVLFEGVDKEQALAYAQMLRVDIERLHLKHEKNSASPYVTVSIGLVFHSKDTPMVGAHKFYRLGDGALYSAKDRGKNKVEVVVV